MTMYGIIKEGLKNLNIEEHCYVFKSTKTTDIVRWIRENGVDEEDNYDNFCIEIFEVDAEGEFVSGSDFDSVSNFLRRRAYLIRKKSGLSQASFAAKYGIPKRTVENWESFSQTSGREAPDYVLDLLERAVTEDFRTSKDYSHLIGKTYEDPEGEWEVVGIDGNTLDI